MTRFVKLAIGTCALVIGVAASAGSQEADQFFDAGTLHEVRIAIHSDDWRRLQEGYLENTYYPADFTWNGVRVRNAGIRSRGNASRNDRKPGLRVDVDRYVTDQRFLGLKSFVLDNLVQDPTFIKERVAMRMFERMGLAAPREAHARVYVNEEYLGVYALVESIDKDFIARVYQGREAAPGRPERDGVIFEYQWQGPYYFSYFGPELEPYAQRFEPKTHEQDSPDALYGPLRDLCRLITESSDASFTDSVGAYVDLDQWVRYVAVDNFIADADGILGFAGMNNFYLYRLERGVTIHIIPWDKDQAFENAARSIWANVDQNLLVRRALAVPALRARYLDTLLEAARLASAPGDDGLRGWLELEVDRAFAQVQAWVEADPAKPFANDAVAQEVERVRQVARTRPALVACEVATARGQGCSASASAATR
jgi:spore coat protein CotH